MKTIRTFKFAALLLLCLALFSCGKKNNDENEHTWGNTTYYGTICGTVFDKDTGEPLRAVIVQDSEGAGSAVTGYDGNYEMTIRLSNYIEALSTQGPYQYVYLTAKKEGYYISEEVKLEVSGWDNPLVRADFLLKKIDMK